jgi:hypothetical protein
MDRRNWILSGLLVLQVALVAWLFWPNQTSNVAMGALITGIEGSAINSVKIQSQDRTIELVKGDEGWTLANYGGYPVDEVKVTGLISKVLAIDTGRLVASTASSYNRLQVADDEFTRKIELGTADGQTQTLFVGTSPSLRATNVRLAGNNGVYLTGEVRGSEIGIDASSWINLSYLQIPNADIQAVTIANANGTLDFTRVNTDTWTLAGLGEDEVFNNNNFQTILTRLGTLNMVAPVGKEIKPEYGLEAPTATVTVTAQTAGGETQTQTLVIGAKEEGGTNYYAKSSASEFVVKLASYTAEQFVNDTRDRYLQPPPAPEASSPLTTTTELTTAVPITTFGVLTTTEPLTATTPVTESAELTATEALPPASALTTTSPITATEELTAAEEAAPTATPRATPTPRS